MDLFFPQNGSGVVCSIGTVNQPLAWNSQIVIFLIGRLHARDQTSSNCAFEKTG